MITLNIDKSWTLFLDRDGVLNHEKKDDYVYSKDEFVFYEGALDAMNILSVHFNTIVLVTNQRGIGKGLMSVDDLHLIHDYMLESIVSSGGRIDTIYYCPELDNSDPNRKPNPGMAYLAKNDHPHIDFGKSIMAGNKLSDMQFGRNAGMFTTYIATTNPEVVLPHPLIDLRFNSLLDFALFIEKNHK